MAKAASRGFETPGQSSIPAGATLDPAPPLEGNPVETTFGWTPAATDEGSWEITFTANDGTGRETTKTITVNVKHDSDGDGLPDAWEMDGYTFAGKHVDLANLTGFEQPVGARVGVKDVFVEIDWMEDDFHSHRPFDDAIRSIVKSFADRGIALHVFLSGPVPHREYVSEDTLVWDDFDDDDKGPYFTPEYLPAFHYCLFAHDLSEKATKRYTGQSRNVSGEGRLGASDYIVALGGKANGVGSLEEQAGTFMHELGHNLGLDHGGVDATENKPNYLSVMNYPFQYGLLRSDLEEGEEYKRFDYSFVVLPALSEALAMPGYLPDHPDGLPGLNEARGILGDPGDPEYAARAEALTGYGTKWYFPEHREEDLRATWELSEIDWNFPWSGNPGIETNLFADITGDGEPGIWKGGTGFP